jgi:hypothetical protein
VPGQLGQKLEILSEKRTTAKKLGAQMVEHLARKHRALSSNPSTTKKERKEGRKGGRKGGPVTCLLVGESKLENLPKSHKVMSVFYWFNYP